MNNSDLKLLMTQFVSMEVDFGKPEFAKIFKLITKKDKSISKQIGAPSVFIVSPKEKVVFCGPANPKGIDAKIELKGILVKAIKTTGELQQPINHEAEVDEGQLRQDSKQLRQLIDDGDFSKSAALIGTYKAKAISSGEFDDQQVEDLMNMTGLKFGPPKIGRGLDLLYVRFTKKVEKEAAYLVRDFDSDNTKLANVAAKMIELENAVGHFPEFDETFRESWIKLAKDLSVDEVKEKGKAFAAGEAPAPLMAGPTVGDDRFREWKSKSGKFSIKASLVSFDGSEVVLKKEDGKEVKVKVSSLSQEDHDFLKPK